MDIRNYFQTVAKSKPKRKEFWPQPDDSPTDLLPQPSNNIAQQKKEESRSINDHPDIKEWHKRRKSLASIKGTQSEEKTMITRPSATVKTTQSDDLAEDYNHWKSEYQKASDKYEDELRKLNALKERLKLLEARKDRY
eukprot:TRINITY_DN13660_c0_g1_i1.p1 TRINITY_DN13660_c0_g1~~TRINITY_DN13660_c0_g1_i1.p1  ORF type:complete len:138 (-),score=36.41 TRINITY_DN13660_c0_g1_i1:15-428(-)